MCVVMGGTVCTVGIGMHVRVCGQYSSFEPVHTVRIHLHVQYICSYTVRRRRSTV